MNVSYRWLRDLVPELDAKPERVAERLALRGAPVEEVRSPGLGLADVVVGKVLTAGPHPGADRLSLCTVDGGSGAVQVVCGAPNVAAGKWYPFAPVGAVLPGDFRIKKAKIRGEVSEGMLCSAKELGLGTDHSGIFEIQGDFEPGQSFVQALGLDDVTLEVEVTVNRGDLLSHVGIARELRTEGDGVIGLTGVPGGRAVTGEYRDAEAQVETDAVTIRIQDPDLCPRYLGAVVRGVRIGPSPAWLQARLRGAGARPINNVVDATNLVMLELGQPIHAFDLRRLKGSAVVVRRARPEEVVFATLDQEERRLSPDMLMICDAEEPVAIAGVMGGLRSEVATDTVDLLLEVALFEPKSIRATRRALGMSTDASYRFERGVDPDGMRTALERCVEIVLAVAGGRLEGPLLDCGPGRAEPPLIALRLARVEHLLGIPFTPERVRALLTPLGFDVSGGLEGTFQIRVPGFRSYDVRREVDLIEEIARTHGYDAFPASLGPYRPGTVPDHPLFQLEDALRGALAARGLFESQTPAFVPPGEGDVEVSNPLTTTEPFMRRSLLPSLLRRVEYNFSRGNRDVRLFELGTSFRRAGRGEPPQEATELAVVLTGRREPPHWSRPDEPLAIWDLKAIFEDVGRRAYGSSAVVTPTREDSGLFEASSALEMVDAAGHRVGRGGRIGDGIVDAPVWAGEVWALELTLPVHVAARAAVRYAALPQFPGTERDLALLVPEGVSAEQVRGSILEAGGGQLEDVVVFDVYESPTLADGTRSLAYRLRFRAPDRTLKDKEVDGAIADVLERLQEDFGVQTRA